MKMTYRLRQSGFATANTGDIMSELIILLRSAVMVSSILQSAFEHLSDIKCNGDLRNLFSVQ